MAIWPVVRVLALKELRTRWRGLLLLALLAVVWMTATMAATAGARRTASVVDRFQETTLASDATFSVSGDRSGEELFDAVSARTEVAAADMLWSASTGLAYDRGHWVALIAGLESVWGREFDLPVVVRGRTPDPSSATEVLVTRGAAEVLDVEVGDQVAVSTWSRATLDAWYETRGAYPPFDGPQIDVTVVGVAELAVSLGGTRAESLFIVVTPAFVERWRPSIGENATTTVVDFHDDQTDPTFIARELTTTVGLPVDTRTAEESYAAPLRDSTDASSVGLVVLAIAVAVAGGLVVGLGVGREVRRSALAVQPIRALGATRLQRVVVMTTPIAIVGTVAAAAATGISLWASRLFPLGSAAAAEPTPGVRIDHPVLASSVVFVAFMLLVSVVCALYPERSWSRRAMSTSRPTAFVRNLGPAAFVGHLNAVGTRQSRVTIFVASFTIMGLTASGWFTQGLQELGKSPDRWGYTWSSSPELGFAAEEFDERAQQLAAHPDMDSVGFVDFAVTLMADTPVRLSAFQFYDGPVATPRVLAGRLPIGTREVALGEQTARALDLSIGDSVLVNSQFAGPAEWKVVGLVVPPYFDASSETGIGAYTNGFNFEALQVPFDSLHRIMVLKYDSAVSVSELERELTDLGFVFHDRSHARQPRSIADIVDVSIVLIWLLLFFAVLGAFATLIGAVRHGSRHGRDLAILRSLGFTRRDVRRTLAAEAVTVALIAATCGVVLGLLVCRRAWQLTTGGLGVVDSQPSPLVVGVGVVALAAIATVLSIVFSRVAVAREPSSRIRVS